MKKLIGLAVLGAVVLAGCTGGGQVAYQQKEQSTSAKYQQALDKAEPYPIAQMKDSTERRNLIERLLRFNDPNKIGYLYLMSDFGRIIAYFTIKGKPSSTDSQLTTQDQYGRYCYSSGGGTHDCAILHTVSPGDDGTYGPEECGRNGIFFFTTENVLIEWCGKWLYSDYPLQLTTGPVLTYNAKNAHPSNTSKTTASPTPSPAP